MGVMRGAAAATVATVLGLIGCQEEVTAIRVIVVPDDAVRVRQADHLEVYVGYGMELVPRDIQVHADDGRVVTYDIGSFLEPIEIYLTDDGASRPFWVGVRAVYQATGLDEVVGEGGHPTPLVLEPDVVREVRIDVRPTRDPANDTRFPYVWQGCPGWTDEDGTRHHIVGQLDSADCDQDGFPYAQGSEDCDDFDPTFNPSAEDSVCDHVDHTCGANTFVGQSDRCVGVIDPGTCVLGTAMCVDNEAPPADCAGPGTPMPPQICQQCSTEVGLDLLTCIKDAATGRATCTLFQDGLNFCQSEPVPLLIQPSWWMHAGGTSTGRTARWLALLPPAPVGLEYAWVNGDPVNPMVVAQQTMETPPSPAFLLSDGDLGALPDPLQESNMVVITGGLQAPELYVVDVEVTAVPDCLVGPTPSCEQWPINMGVQ
jgi:hypothetical protein